MNWWHQITALGGLGVTAPICIGIAVWLAAAHCRRRALEWVLLFGAAMCIVMASKIAFIGWGIGVMALDFAGFSGHAARAGAVFPVAAYLLCRLCARRWRIAAVVGALLLAAAVALSRVILGNHSTSEAVSGLMLGAATAAAFIGMARSQRSFSPSPWLVGLTLVAVLLQPHAKPGLRVSSQQLLTGVALHLSGNDRPYSRHTWKPTGFPYIPPCPLGQRRLEYLCL